MEVDTNRVVWKFRFEFTGASQPRTVAWWQPYDEEDPKNLPTPLATQKDARWDLWSAHGQASVSYTPPPLSQHENRGPDTEAGRADLEGKTWRCSTCNGISTRPYARLAYCINEACERWTDVAEHISAYIMIPRKSWLTVRIKPGGFFGPNADSPTRKTAGSTAQPDASTTRASRPRSMGDPAAQRCRERVLDRLGLSYLWMRERATQVARVEL